MLDYGGGHELSKEELKVCLRTATTAVKHLCLELETTLEQADEVAQKEILQKLKLRQSGETAVAMQIDNAIEEDSRTNDNESSLIENAHVEEPSKIDDTTTQAEEAYRQQALDYSIGHIASSVREDDSRSEDKKIAKGGGSLFASLLKAAGDRSRSSSTQGHTKIVDLTNDVAQEAMSTEPSNTIATKQRDAQATTSHPDSSSDEEEEPIVMNTSEFSTSR